MHASQTHRSRYVSPTSRWHICRIIASVMTGVVLAASQSDAAWAQGVSDAQPLAGRTIETVRVRIDTPSADTAFNTRIEDSVRRALGLFPGAAYSEDRISFALGSARRNPAVETIDYEGLPSATGGVDLTVTVQLRDSAQPAAGRGMAATGKSSGFPLILDRNGTYLRFKLDAFALYHANNNAW